MGERYKPQFSGSPFDGTMPVLSQAPHNKKRLLDERIARLAYEEYERQYGNSQSFERLHQRGGFSVGEVITLLADALLRERSRK